MWSGEQSNIRVLPLLKKPSLTLPCAAAYAVMFVHLFFSILANAIQWIGKLILIVQLCLTQLLIMTVSTGYGINRSVGIILCFMSYCSYD